MSFRGPVNTSSCTYNSNYQCAQKWEGYMSSHKPLWCLNSCGWLLGEPISADFGTAPTTDPRTGDAVIAPIRNLLFPGQLKILPQFLCCSDSQIN